MPLGVRRNPYTRKLYRRAKRSYRKVAKVLRLSSMLPRGNSTPLTFCQSFVSSINATAMTDLNIAHKVKFSDLPNYADFQKLFQQYKVNWFEVKWVPTHSQYDPNNGTAFTDVPMYWAIDYDQDAVPTVSEILKFGNLRVSKFKNGFRKKIYPTTTITGSSTNEIKKKSKYVWFDTTNADQYHNGLDLCIPSGGWGASNMLVGYFITKVCFSVKFLDGTNN